MDSNHFAVTVADFDAFLTRLRSAGVTYYAENGELTVQTRGDGVRQTTSPTATDTGSRSTTFPERVHGDGRPSSG